MLHRRLVNCKAAINSRLKGFWSSLFAILLSVQVVLAGNGFQFAPDTCSNPANTPRITALSHTGTGCVDGATDIFIFPSVFPLDPGNYTYSWTGPGGYVYNDTIGFIANATSADSGYYYLVVTDAGGCMSNPDSILVSVSDVPVRPVIGPAGTFCTGDRMELVVQNASGYSGSNISYEWMTPLGSIHTADPFLVIDPADVTDTGNYGVRVTANGCTSDTSILVPVTVFARPAQPVAISTGPFCVGGPIRLSTDSIDGATYSWTGPNGFSASNRTPLISNATMDDAGFYQVRVTLNNCSSVSSLPVSVVVQPNLEKPVAAHDGPVCIDKNAELKLMIPDSSYIPGANYTWVDALTLDTVAGPALSQSTSLVNFSSYGDGVFDFYVFAELGGCSSPDSDPVSVTMNLLPDSEAMAGDDLLVCDQDSIILRANDFNSGNGMWTQTMGPPVVIDSAMASSATVRGIQSGQRYQFRWGLSNGVCGEYDADSILVFVDNTSDIAMSASVIEVCDSSMLTLDAQLPLLNNKGSWSQSASQSERGIIIVNPDDTNAVVEGLFPGESFEFIWTVSNRGCGDFSTDTTIVTIYDGGNVAYAGEDFAVCSNPTATLRATGMPGMWSSPDADVDIASPDENETLVDGLAVGANQFVWTVDNGACGISKDSVLIGFEEAVVPRDDSIFLEFAAFVDVEVALNDFLPGPYTIRLFSQPSRGSVTKNGEVFRYTSDPDFSGIDRFAYEVCSKTCLNACATAIVTVKIDNEPSCVVPTIFTPNDDGVNDFFDIPCLTVGSEYPNNSVSIFNQWGDEVFRASPYKNDWRGTFRGRDLPIGTYFYIVHFGNGKNPESGFLILER